MPIWTLALQQICDEVGVAAVWAVSGSTALALHGLPVEPHDLDVITDAAGVSLLAKKFGGTPASDYSGNGVSAALYLHRVLRGASVDVLGDVSHRRLDGSWSEPASARDFTVPMTWRGYPIHVLSVERLRQIAVDRGRTDQIWLLDAAYPELR